MRLDAISLKSLTIAGALCLAGLSGAQPQWSQYAGNAQHTATDYNGIQRMNHILWQIPIDSNPPYSGSDLLIHYGSPLVAQGGTVLATERIEGSAGNAPYTYQVEGVDPSTGTVLWTEKTDWIEPAHDWIPSCGSAIGPDNRLYTPGAGGTVYIRSNADSAAGTVTQVAFYGIANYNANQSGYNSDVYIDTPLTVDNNGNVYFGFIVTSAIGGLSNGIARISSSGVGSWISTDTATGHTGTKIPTNCTPAVSNDGTAVYIGTRDVSDYNNPELVELDSTTLATIHTVGLVPPPENGTNATFAYMLDDGTASPMIGPDGDIYIGIWWSDLASRGFMLHYSSDLQTQKFAGGFGWDDTASIVPASAVPGYHGTSTYLILSKYNNYADPGCDGDGLNRVGILDPNTSEQYTVQYGPTHNPPNSTGPTYTVMNEVMTVLGPTANSGLAGVREWCINSAAIDVPGKAAIINSEDGHCYRWDLTTGALEDNNNLAPPTGEAYTPTIASADGLAFAVNNATLACMWDGAVASAVTLTATNIPNGNSTTAKITLKDQVSGSSTTATGPGATFTLTSTNPNITVPATVTVPNGSSTVTFTVSTAVEATDQTATITATRYGFSATSATLTAHNSEMTNLSINKPVIYGNQTGNGTVNLAAVAWTGRTITMSSNLASISFNHTSIPVGGTTYGTFTYTAQPIANTTSGTITATLDDGSTRSVAVTVHAATVNHLSLSPATIGGGATTQMTVFTASATPAAGINVSLTYSAHTSGPATVNVGPSNSNVVSVSSTAPATTVTETLKATYESSSATISITIEVPGTLSAFTAATNTPTMTSSDVGTVTLNSLAGAAAHMTATASDAYVTFVNQPTVASNQTTGTFTMKAGTLTNGVTHSTTVTVKYLTVSKTQTLTIQPITLSSITATSVLHSNQIGLGTVTLSAAAGVTNISVKVSSPSTLVTVPATCTVLAGHSTGTFTITAHTITTTRRIPIYGSLNLANRTTFVLLEP